VRTRGAVTCHCGAAVGVVDYPLTPTIDGAAEPSPALGGNPRVTGFPDKLNGTGGQNQPIRWQRSPLPLEFGVRAGPGSQTELDGDRGSS
jgi:hypothetical protein